MKNVIHCAPVVVGINFRNLLFLIFELLIFVPIDGDANRFGEGGGKEIVPVEVQLCRGFIFSHLHEILGSNNHHNINNNSVNNSATDEIVSEVTSLTWSFPAPITAEQSNFIVVLKPSQVNCDYEEIKLNVSRPAASGVYTEEFLASGYFRKELDYFHPREYCISELSDELVTVKICHRPTCGPADPCIPICCPLEKLFTPGLKKLADNSTQASLKCVAHHKGSSHLSPVLYSNPNKKVNREFQLHYRRKLLATFKCINNSRPLLMPFATNEAAIKTYGMKGLCYRIRVDGTLMYRNSYSEWGEIRAEDYCLDGMQYGPTDKLFSSTEEEFGVLLCGLPPSNPVRFHSELYGITMIVASSFLLLTFLVHVLLWSQQNIHGWITMCHASSMFFMYLFLGTSFLLVSSHDQNVANTLGCKILGIITHFCFLSTFCWLTLINFDLFWTFRCMSPRSQRSRGLGRFLLYVLFGWGVPFVFVAISVTIDYVYSSELCSMVLTPEYGVFNCYVAKYSLGRYIYYPVAVLWSVNIVFFATTTYKLYVYKKSTRIATQNMNERQQLFQLFIKLFFVMGFTWIFEFLSWLHAGNEMRWYWTIFDFINLLQAVAIFIIFVCKPDIICSLQNKYPAFKPILRPIHICLICRTPARDAEPNTSYTTADETLSRSSMKTRPSMRISS